MPNQNTKDVSLKGETQSKTDKQIYSASNYIQALKAVSTDGRKSIAHS